MSTRGAFGFRINGKDKVTYNHSDSYYSWLMCKLIKQINEHADLFKDMGKLKKLANKIKLVKEGKAPKLDLVKKVKDWNEAHKIETLNLNVGANDENTWYCLLRGIHGHLDYFLDGFPVMIDSLSFLGDSLFCEYAYIVNFDTGMFEIYEGFNKKSGGRGRYAEMGGEPCYDGGPIYFGVVLVAEIPLEKLANADNIDEVGKKLCEILDSEGDGKEKKIEELLAFA